LVDLQFFNKVMVAENLTVF